jgi:hypothetical protein
VDWHSPGRAGIAAPGEMWTGYPHPVRVENRATTWGFEVIPVLPITTAETGSPSIRKNETCGRRQGVGSSQNWFYCVPSISTSASQFTGAFSGSIIPIEERACIPASGPYSSRMRSE